MEKLLFGGGEKGSSENPSSPCEKLSVPEGSSVLALEDIQFGEEIGRGAFGTVKRGLFKGKDVAVKSLIVRDLVSNSLVKYFYSELEVLQSLDHPHLLRYYGCVQRGNTVHIVTEFMRGGSLSQLITPPSVPPLPWNLIVHLAVCVAEGLAHLHSRDLLHRDIKTENLLLDDNWRIVIADYGFSKKVVDLRGGVRQPGTILGTEAFMAPEVQFGEAYGEGADVFSLGCVLAEMLCGREVGKNGFLERTPRNKFAADLDVLRGAALPDSPPSLIECTCQCLAYEPENRLSAELVYDWLTDLKGELPPLDLSSLPNPSALRKGGGGGNSN